MGKSITSVTSKAMNNKPNKHKHSAKAKTHGTDAATHSEDKMSRWKRRRLHRKLKKIANKQVTAVKEIKNSSTKMDIPMPPTSDGNGTLPSNKPVLNDQTVNSASVVTSSVNGLKHKDVKKRKTVNKTDVNSKHVHPVVHGQNKVPGEKSKQTGAVSENVSTNWMNLKQVISYMDLLGCFFY